eukprot:COSAG04_NODE_1021_length_8711_cov_4.217069_4_plen_619_part_00
MAAAGYARQTEALRPAAEGQQGEPVEDPKDSAIGSATANGNGNVMATLEGSIVSASSMQRLLLLLVPLLCSAAPAAGWTFEADGFQLWASEAPGGAPYSTYQLSLSPALGPAGAGGAGGDTEWLVGEPPAVHCGGAWADAADGSLRFVRAARSAGADMFGGYEELAWHWRTAGGVAVETAFRGYARSGAAQFVTRFPGGCPDSNYTALPSNASTPMQPEGHGGLAPSSEFPSFAASGGAALVSERMGYATVGGSMTYREASRGTGLAGFRGGAEGGPLALFGVNASRGPAAVLSPADGFFHGILGVRTACSRQRWSRAGRSRRYAGTDFGHNDLGSQHGTKLTRNSSDACEAACRGAPMCSAWSWAPPGSAKAGRCWLKHSTAGAYATRHVSGAWCADPPGSPRALAFGLQPYLRRAPPGASLRLLLSPLGAGGLTAAMDKWGRILTAAYNTTRAPARADDPVVSTLGYWTDNGAVYDARQPLNTFGMAALFRRIRQLRLPVQYVQLASFWYSSEESWFPDPRLYPRGLADLQRAIGGGPGRPPALLLYHNFWSRDTAVQYWRRERYPMPVQPSIGFVSKGRTRWIFAVDPAASEPFYDHSSVFRTTASSLRCRNRAA